MAAFPNRKFPKHHRFRAYWRYPWSRAARHSRAFKKFCWHNGYVSPHYTRHEWACHNGVGVSDSLRCNAQRAAFKLEQFRHELGDKPLGAISYYRTPAYNSQIGGASNSRHTYADAADFSTQLVNSIGRSKFLRIANRLYRNGGVGIYPSGSVHVDTRGYKARWSSW